MVKLVGSFILSPTKSLHVYRSLDRYLPTRGIYGFGATSIYRLKVAAAVPNTKCED